MTLEDDRVGWYANGGGRLVATHPWVRFRKLQSCQSKHLLLVATTVETSAWQP